MAGLAAPLCGFAQTPLAFVEPGSNPACRHLCSDPAAVCAAVAEYFYMAGVAGFEPANAGIKTQCLAAWRHPIKLVELDQKLL